jgi:hypothetical protein
MKPYKVYKWECNSCEIPCECQLSFAVYTSGALLHDPVDCPFKLFEAKWEAKE